MLACTQVIAYCPEYRMIGCRHFLYRQSVGMQKPVNSIGIQGREELTLWIGGSIFRCACHINGSRCNKSQQFMLIERQQLFMSVVPDKVIAEPFGSDLIKNCLLYTSW